jgi:hypothetical protein
MLGTNANKLGRNKKRNPTKMTEVLFIAACIAAFLAWRAFTAFVVSRDLRQDPAWVARVYLRDQLKKRGIAPNVIDQDFLASIAARNVLEAERPDGSIDRDALCDLVQQEAIKLAARLIDNPVDRRDLANGAPTLGDKAQQ